MNYEILIKYQCDSLNITLLGNFEFTAPHCQLFSIIYFLNCLKDSTFTNVPLEVRTNSELVQTHHLNLTAHIHTHCFNEILMIPSCYDVNLLVYIFGRRRSEENS